MFRRPQFFEAANNAIPTAPSGNIRRTLRVFRMVRERLNLQRLGFEVTGVRLGNRVSAMAHRMKVVVKIRSLCCHSLIGLMVALLLTWHLCLT